MNQENQVFLMHTLAYLLFADAQDDSPHVVER